MERWRNVKGLESYYQISDKGNIRSKDRKVNRGYGEYLKRGKELKKTLSPHGYHVVVLKVNGKTINKRIHRLVAEAFLEKPEGKELVNHKDGVKTNNKLENLEWCDHAENMKHAIETGLAHSNLKKFEKEILEEYKKGNVSVDFLSKKYKTSPKNLKLFLIEKGIDVKSVADWIRKYNIDKKVLLDGFKKGKTNKELAEFFNVRKDLIATYKYQFKKSNLL